MVTQTFSTGSHIPSDLIPSREDMFPCKTPTKATNFLFLPPFGRILRAQSGRREPIAQWGFLRGTVVRVKASAGLWWEGFFSDSCTGHRAVPQASASLPHQSHIATWHFNSLGKANTYGCQSLTCFWLGIKGASLLLLAKRKTRQYFC